MNKNNTLLCLLLWSIPFISLASAESTKDGVLLYEMSCQQCHSASKSTINNAPTAFAVSIWKQRYQNASAKIKENARFKTVDDYFLYQVSIGKGLMHHGGLCQESKVKQPKLKCDNKTYLEAISYMSHEKPV